MVAGVGVMAERGTATTGAASAADTLAAPPFTRLAKEMGLRPAGAGAETGVGTVATAAVAAAVAGEVEGTGDGSTVFDGGDRVTGAAAAGVGVDD